VAAQCQMTANNGYAVPGLE